MTTHSQYLVDSLLPEWAKEEADLKLFAGALGMPADNMADSQLVATVAGLLASPLSPDDALPLAGKERGGLWRYPRETLYQYRQRLIGAADAFEYGGSDRALISQFEAAGYPGVTIVTHPDRQGPRGEAPPYLSQYWIRFPYGVYPDLVEPIWDDAYWGYFYWEIGALPADFVELCLGIIRKFGDPLCFCRGAELEGYDA